MEGVEKKFLRLKYSKRKNEPSNFVIHTAVTDSSVSSTQNEETSPTILESTQENFEERQEMLELTSKLQVENDKYQQRIASLLKGLEEQKNKNEDQKLKIEELYHFLTDKTKEIETLRENCKQQERKGVEEISKRLEKAIEDVKKELKEQKAKNELQKFNIETCSKLLIHKIKQIQTKTVKNVKVDLKKLNKNLITSPNKMERSEERKSLRLKYLKRKEVSSNSTGVSNTQKAETTALESAQDSFQKRQETLELNSKLQLENTKYQQEIAFLQKQLEDQKSKNELQKLKIEKLSNSLNDKTKEIEKVRGNFKPQGSTTKDVEELKERLNEQDRNFLHLKKIFAAQNCSFEEFHQVLLGLKHELNRKAENLETEILKKMELEAELSKERKMVEDLEKCFSAEVAKNKKLEIELQFVLQYNNKEKEKLKNEFEEFKRETLKFLSEHKEQKSLILKCIEEY